MIETISEMYSFTFMQNALAVGVFGGGLLAFLGIFVHLRRIVFLGAALPQIVATGIAAAVFFAISPILGAIGGGILGIVLLSFTGKKSHLPPDGWIGLAFAAGSSVAIVLVALSPAPDGEVLRFFTGDILGTTRSDALFAFGAAIAVGIIFRLFWSRIVITGFDPVMSATMGIKVQLWDALVFLCLGVALAIVMNTAGGMLAFSMLVGPSAAALILFRSFPLIIIFSVLTGMLASFGGLTASFLYDLPGGPAMATAALVPVVIAWIYNSVKALKYRRV
ncbi:metal ABC transporter permease [Chitinispirillales bacterium ANBcel5]|uniref:metal ABC transporter permease n=1 Tax=Cellulosispirillum alkaliphilum TaxID=3039283 RepID=UPI002A58B8FC|nr:metal ABC transporter permease [Chitinispirillales bacterium ANBcel5]